MRSTDDSSPFATSSETTRRRLGEVVSTLEDGLRAAGHELIDAYPSLEKPVVGAWYLYVYAYIRAVALKNTVEHEAEIDPFRLYRVSPDRLTQYKRKPAIVRDLERLEGDTTPGLPTPPPEAKFKYAGRVIGGDWDENCASFEEGDLYRAFEAHFQRGVSWADTAFFERVVEEIENGRPRWGCRTRDEFEDRCKRLDRLYHNIREHGYHTQAELADGSVDDPIDRDGAADLERFVYHEMTVSVGRDGELIFNDGHDRLAIAKLLDLDTVPVWIMIRHAEWQRLRDAFAAGSLDPADLASSLRNHPDLRHVGPES